MNLGLLASWPFRANYFLNKENLMSEIRMELKEKGNYHLTTYNATLNNIF